MEPQVALDADHSPRFTEEKLAHLKEHGWVVIENVVEDEECERSFKEMLDAFAAYNPELTPGNGPAWSSANMPAGTLHGINRILSHLPFQWRLRQHPNVVRLFADYWQCKPDELLTSFDAFNYYRADQRRVHPDYGHWTHTDQGPHANDVEPLDGKCLQGYVNLIDSMSPNAGTLVVYDKAHRAHTKFFEHTKGSIEYEKADKKNWHRFPKEWLDEIENDGRPYLLDSDPDKNNSKPIPMRRTRVHAPRGAMVFWYSKTPHQNQPPYRFSGYAPMPDRAVQYICQIPKKHATPQDKRRRSRGWEQLRQSNHWAAGGQFDLFTKYPRMRRDVSAQKEDVDRMYKYMATHRPMLHSEYVSNLQDGNLSGALNRFVLSPLGESLLGYVPVETRGIKRGRAQMEALVEKGPAKMRQTKLLWHSFPVVPHKDPVDV